MAQKGRNDITQVVNQNIFDNNQKEILASMVREVLADIRDSYFNLVDDELHNTIYEGNTTLGDVLSQSALVPPLWGATLWFDVNGENTDGNNEGIVEETTVMPGTPSSKTQLIIKFTQPIAGKKLLVNVFTDNLNPHMHSNICTPVIKAGYNSKEIKVGLMEVGGGVAQKVRLEIFAFTINQG